MKRPSPFYGTAPSVLAAISLAFACVSTAGAQKSPASGEKPVTLNEIVGAWASTVDNARFEIRKVDETHVVLLGKGGREWKGEYKAGELKFTRKPTAEEMNPGAPDWVRKNPNVAGKLVWRIDLTSKKDADEISLRGSFYPGEITWTSEKDLDSGQVVKEEAAVTGSKGKPIPLSYTRAYNWAIADTLVMSAKPAKVSGMGIATDLVLFAYGPRMPAKKTQVKRIASDTPEIEYEVIAVGADTASMSNADASLLFDGWKLAKRGISAHDAKILDAQWQAILIKAHVPSNVLPGRYGYRIGGIRGAWNLNHGTPRAALRVWREIPDSPGEPTQFAYLGEKIFTVIDVPERLLVPPTGEIPLMVGVNGSWMLLDGDTAFPFGARLNDAASTGSSIFRSVPIELVWDTDPRLPRMSKVALGGSRLLLAVDPGDHIQIAFADSRQFVTDATIANVFVSSDEEGPWISALRRAAVANGLPADIDLRGSRGKSVSEVSNFMITQVAFKLRLQYLSPLVRFIQMCYGFSDAEMAQGNVTARNKITLGNHAAAILLRDEFVERMQPLVSELNELKSPQEQVNYLAACKTEILNPRSALGTLEVTDPEPDSDNMGPDFKLTLREIYTSGIFARPDMEPHRRKWILEAFKTYRKAVVDAQQKAIDTKDNDIQDLLALTGDCFEPVIKSLVPKLMRPVRDVKGSVTWEPDPLARAEVKHLSTTWEAIKAQREFASLDKEVAIAAVTCTLQFGGVLTQVLARVVAAANIASGVYGAYTTLSAANADLPKELFAIGSSHVLGNERFNMVEEQKTPTWAIVINLVGLGMVGLDIPTLMGQVPTGQAVAAAPRAAASIREGGLAAVKNVPKEDLTAYFCAAGAVQAKAAEKGAESLTLIERDIRDSLMLLEKDMQAQGIFKIDLTASELAGSPKSLAKQENVIVPQKQAVKAPASPSENLPPFEPPTTLTDPKTYEFLLNRRKLKGDQWIAAKEAMQETVPCGFPLKKGEWRYNGVSFELGSKVGEGSLMAVFEEIGTKKVLKVCKWTGNIMGAETWDEMQLAQKLLKEAEIMFYELEFGPRPGAWDLFWCRQTRLPPDAVVPRADMMLDAGQREAIMDLIEKFYKAKYVAEDLKTNNVYLLKIGNKWVAGILDIDRVCKWGRFTSTIDSVLQMMEANTLKLKSVVRGRPVDGKRLLTFEEFWKVQLEKGAWLTIGADGKKVMFQNRVLDAEEVFKRFKWLGRREDKVLLHDRPPLSTKPISQVPEQPIDIWRRLALAPSISRLLAELKWPFALRDSVAARQLRMQRPLMAAA